MNPSSTEPPNSTEPVSSTEPPGSPQPGGMNRYGRQAIRHWATHLPTRYAQIPDPVEFFTTMGREIAEEIADLSAQLATRQPSEPTYLDEVGRLNRLRSQAEEQILHERVFQTSSQTTTESGTGTPESP